MEEVKMNGENAEHVAKMLQIKVNLNSKGINQSIKYLYSNKNTVHYTLNNNCNKI